MKLFTRYVRKRRIVHNGVAIIVTLAKKYLLTYAFIRS